jgi:hypothetical protein
MQQAGRIVSFDWDRYDQSSVVYRPAQMTAAELRRGQIAAYDKFYGLSSLARRFPLRGVRSRAQWAVYSLFMKRGAATDRKDTIAAPTEPPDAAPMPPILPANREWREAILAAAGDEIAAVPESALRGSENHDDLPLLRKA